VSRPDGEADVRQLLPRGAGSAASVELGAQIMFYGGDIVDLLLATALLLDWYRRGARALAREERRYAGAGPRCPRGDEGYMDTVSTTGGTSA
jgi:cytochrome c oxidase assembly factor CtaG